MASTRDVIEYLNLLRSGPTVAAGPHRLWKSSHDTKRKRADELSRDIQLSVIRLRDREFWAPSPWHAAAWLLDLTALAAQETDIDESGLECPYPASWFGGPIFRGQLRQSWPLTPTLFREPQNPAAEKAIILFVLANSGLFDAGDDTRSNTPRAHMAAAQHYGLATPLLDFTADPRVAVYFACDGTEKDPKEPAAVFFLPFRLLDALGGGVVLPPVWVKRLYKQRGLLIDCSQLHLDGKMLQSLAFKISFLPDKEYCKELGFLVNLLPEEEWYSCAIRWAKEMAQGVRDVKVKARDIWRTKEFSSTELTEAMTKCCGKSPFIGQSISVTTHQEGLDSLVDMCEWLALKFRDGGLQFDSETLIRIGRLNRDLFSAMASLWSYVKKTSGRRRQFRSGPLKYTYEHRTCATVEAIGRCLEALRTFG